MLIKEMREYSNSCVIFNMQNDLFNEITDKFQLNQMQKKAFEKLGYNIVLNAPTGAGKTEAILLNMNRNEEYYYFLPTITSCIFMYNRLKKDYKNIDIEIKTSLLTDRRAVENCNHKITICTPDPVMIEYLSSKKEKDIFIAKNLILDELDNYPEMVKRALIEYCNEFKDSHIIVASATLDDELLKAFSKFYTINYDLNKKLIKHKVNFIHKDREIVNIVKNNTDKKIGIICNSIKDMEFIADVLENNKIKYLYHHSKLNEYERLNNENKIFNKDFSVLLSNDLVSYSVDIDFEILIMQLSDKLNVNIQRLGRNNRYNKTISYKNLYIIHPANCCQLPFINEYSQYEQLEYFKNCLTFNDLKEMKEKIVPSQIPQLNEIFDYWKRLEELELEKNLRKVPLNFKEKVQIKVTKWSNGRKETKIVNTHKVYKFDYIPYDNFNDKFLYIQGKHYKIVDKTQQYYLIEECEDEYYGEFDDDYNEYDEE